MDEMQGKVSMMEHAWILAAVITLNSGKVVVVPFAGYGHNQFGYAQCIVDRDNIHKNTKLIMTCTEEKKA